LIPFEFVGNLFRGGMGSRLKRGNWIAGGIMVLPLFYLAGSYNRLVTLRNRWS